MRFLKIFLLSLSALFCAACGDGEREERLVMVTEATFPPYEFREGDRVVGIDPEIMREVADELGRRRVRLGRGAFLIPNFSFLIFSPTLLLHHESGETPLLPKNFAV